MYRYRVFPFFFLSYKIRGGKICLTDHFYPLWARNVPHFGIAHALALGVTNLSPFLFFFLVSVVSNLVLLLVSVFLLPFVIFDPFPFFVLLSVFDFWIFLLFHNFTSVLCSSSSFFSFFRLFAFF